MFATAPSAYSASMLIFVVNLTAAFVVTVIATFAVTAAATFVVTGAGTFDATATSVLSATVTFAAKLTAVFVVKTTVPSFATEIAIFDEAGKSTSWHLTFGPQTVYKETPFF